MKLFVAVFLAVFTVAFGRTAHETGHRIAGGDDTTIEEHPFQISLQYQGQHNCGGSILNEDTIVTAAHCTVGFNKDEMTVKAGMTYVSDDVEVFQIETVIEHPEYGVDTRFNNDVAILKLASKLTFSDKISAIELTDAAPAEGATATVTGWGATYQGGGFNEILQVTNVNIVNHDECSEKYGGSRISDKMLCAWGKRKDACVGDSGGPLVVDGKLVGIVSFGKKCPDRKYPGVYSDVSVLKDFITENI